MQSNFTDQNVKSLQKKLNKNKNKDEQIQDVYNQLNIIKNNRSIQSGCIFQNSKSNQPIYFQDNILNQHIGFQDNFPNQQIDFQGKIPNQQIDFQDNLDRIEDLNFQFQNILELSNQVFTTKPKVCLIQEQKKSCQKHQQMGPSNQELIASLRVLKMSFSKCPLYRSIDLLYKKYNMEVDQKEIFLLDPDAERRKCKIDLQIQLKKSLKKYNKLKKRMKNYKSSMINEIKSQDLQNETSRPIQTQQVKQFKQQHIPQNNQDDQNASISHTEKSQKQHESPNNLQISKKFLAISNPLLNTRRKPSQRKDHYNEKYKAQRMIAKVYCVFGYGMQIARQNFGPNIDRNIYNNTITTMIRQSFRKLQDFLTKQCQKQIKQLTRQQYCLIKTQLIHCRKYFEMNEVRSFLKFIKLTYRIRTEDPTQEEAINLYLSIVKKVQKKEQAKRLKKLAQSNQQSKQDQYDQYEQYDE